MAGIAICVFGWEVGPDWEHVAPVQNRTRGRMLLDLVSDACYGMVANIEAHFLRCVVHVIRMCHALLTSRGGRRSNGRTAAGLKLGAIPVGPAICVPVAFIVRLGSTFRHKPRGGYSGMESVQYPAGWSCAERFRQNRTRADMW
jgi:hypothetical protein